jgi:hypothetical protein
MADLANKITQFEKDKAQSDSEAFMARLTARLPNWQQLMQSAEYLVWRDTATEPFTAKTYGELFDQANSQWNLEGMVGVFKAFINAHPNWTPPQLTTIDNPGVTPPPQPPSPPADPRAAMVTPGQRSATPSAPAGNEPRTFKQSEVEAIFTNMRRGLYTQEEMMRLDREIMEANVQGRIVAG